MRSTGVVVDEVLARELAHPGSDSRHGVNLVCCPGPGLIEKIAAIQRRLSEFEPGQYYYPPNDLHLTLVEICHSRSEAEAASIAHAVQSLAPSFLARERPAALHSPELVFDEKAVAVRFLPCDDRLQQLRASIREHLAAHRVVGDPRYPQRSAHITFLRYLEPLRTPAEAWFDLLGDCRIELDRPWVLDEVWLTWGATWYGMASRTKKGPA
jgi:hypothetical protein